MARIVIPVALSAVLLGSAAGPAFAAHPASGVHVDPGSPAGVEYAIPLAQARSIGRTARRAVLFGAGISKAPSGRGAVAVAPTATPPIVSRPSTTETPTNTSGKRASSSGAERAAIRAAEADVGRQTMDLSTASVRALGGDRPSGLLWMVAIGAAVLGLGVLIGLAVARRGRSGAARVR